MRKIASLKTIPGREEACAAAVKSLEEQVDHVYVWQESPRSNGDADKFNGLFEERLNTREPFLFLSCDDDLIYPKDYALFMEMAVAAYGGIVSCHGRKFTKRKIDSYYGEGICYHCLQDVEGVHRVDCGGTGVMAFMSDTCSGLTSLDFPRGFPLMADIHVGLWARANRVPIHVLPHKAGWIRSHPSVREEQTIWARYHQRDRMQTKRVNTLLSLPAF